MVFSEKKGKSMFLIEIKVEEMREAKDIIRLLNEGEENGKLDFPFEVKLNDGKHEFNKLMLHDDGWLVGDAKEVK